MSKQESNGSLESLKLEERWAEARAHQALADATESSVRLHLRVGDARQLQWIPDQSIHLVVTSPPYWSLKEYKEHPDQLGRIQDYEEFLDQPDSVWRHVHRVLVPGGRLVCVVGDVCLSRRENGRHVVIPLHADNIVRCRKLGFDNLTPILWYKIANASLEVDNGSRFLGKPYEPNAIIKNDIEFILMQRKPGGYRKPSEQQRKLSMIEKVSFADWFQQVWRLAGASTKDHPAPFPIELGSLGGCQVQKMVKFASWPTEGTASAVP